VYLSDPAKSTIVLEVYTSVGQFQVDWPAFLALNVMALVPMVIFFPPYATSCPACSAAQSRAERTARFAP
jgi:hypothetical protein